jgi:hypothetical protein
VIPVYDPIIVSGLTFTPIHRTDELYTGFFQDDISLVRDRLTLTLGTKLLHTNFTTFEPEPSPVWHGPLQKIRLSGQPSHTPFEHPRKRRTISH